MTDRPIIFSAPMVRALLEGRKTQTRRILKVQPIQFAVDDAGTLCDVGCLHAQGERLPRVTLGRVVTLQELPYAIGDRLWVRESWRATEEWDCRPPREIQPGYVRYEADPCVAHSYGKLRPSLFMPRWASRLTLLVMDVQVERLNDISETDARAEGVHPICDHGVGNQHLHSIAFEQLWCSLHGDCAWIANPWVVAVSFEVIARNIDDLPVPALPATDALAAGKAGEGSHIQQEPRHG